MTKGCFRCAADNFIRACVTLRLSFKYFKQSIRCIFHSAKDKRKYDSLCTKLSSASNNIHQCDPSIHFFNMDKTLPVNVHLSNEEDEVLRKTIEHMKYAIKMQTMTSENKAAQLKMVKWLDELYYYKQINSENIHKTK